MSNRKTKKEKIRAAERRIKKHSKELIELSEKANELEEKITEAKKENIKQFHIRNLKIFTSTCNFLAPFVISSGIFIGLFRIFDGGYPFHLDEITKYKVYNMDYETDGQVNTVEEYKKSRWFDDSLPANKLVIYTPWELEEGNYVRIKREYNLGKSTTLELYDAVLHEDYDYVSENIAKYKEEKQVVNTLNLEENNYVFEASLHMFDKEDTLKYNETEKKNIIITIIELVLGIGIGGIYAYFRDFEYLYEVVRINDRYHSKISLIAPMKKELEETNKKILSLSKNKGGKI